MENSVITITQSLVKSYPMRDTRGVDFTKKEQDWKSMLKNNKVLSPMELIDEFRDALEGILRGEELDHSYCREMVNQCKNWEITDQFSIIE